MEVATLIVAIVAAAGALATPYIAWRLWRHTRRVDERRANREIAELRRALYEDVVYKRLTVNAAYNRSRARHAGLNPNETKFILSYREERDALDSDNRLAGDERNRRARALDEKLRLILLTSDC